MITKKIASYCVVSAASIVITIKVMLSKVFNSNELEKINVYKIEGTDVYKRKPEENDIHEPYCIIEELFNKYYQGRYLGYIVPSWEEYYDKVHVSKYNNIPLILHNVWLAKSYSPRELDEKTKMVISNNINLLRKEDKQWKYYLWTNQKELLPSTVEYVLDLGGIVKDINTFKEYSLFAHKVNQLINFNFFSHASDIIRGNILKEYGGIYCDTDFHFHNSPKLLHDTLDLYASFEKLGWKKQIGTGFIAAKPYHPVIIKYVNIIKSSYGIGKISNSPFSLCEVMSCTDAALMIGGPIGFTVAFNVNSNIMGNQDLILQQGMIHEPENASQVLNIQGSIHEILKIGTHHYRGSWVNTCQNLFLNPQDSVIMSPHYLKSCTHQQRDYGIHYVIEKILKSQHFVQCSNMLKIPYISHVIWLNNPTLPISINSINQDLVLKSILKLDLHDNNWTHYFWVMNLEQLDLSILDKFKGINIEFRSINEFYSEWEGIEEALSTASKLSFSLAVDVMKWAVIHKYGGIYHDVDFEFRSTDSLTKLHMCSEIYLSHNHDKWITNGYLASSVNHVVPEMAVASYINYLTKEGLVVPTSCAKEEKIMALNIYGHVKPFIDLILSESVKAESVILIPDCMLVNYHDEQKECIIVKYGPLEITNIGL